VARRGTRRAGARSGTGTCPGDDGADPDDAEPDDAEPDDSGASGGEAVRRGASDSMTARRTRTGRAPARAVSPAASCRAGALAAAGTGDFFAFLGRALGG
jgi:hypothetical protein